MKVVLDTNVFVAGLLTSGAAAKVLDLWFGRRFDVLTSEAQLAEIRRVLQTKFSKEVPYLDRARLLARLRKAAIMVHPRTAPDISPDPDDNLILAIALEGKADALVTWDKADLLKVRLKGLRITSVKPFLRGIRGR